MLSKKKAGLVVSLLVAFFITSTVSAEAVYFVGADEDDGLGGSLFTNFPHDGYVKEYLEDLGHEVFYNKGANATTQFAEAFDLLVISSTLGSGDARGKFQNISTPILQWEEALLDARAGNFAITAADGDADNGTDATATEIIITNSNHPLAGGLPEGPIEIATEPIAMPWARNLVDDAISIATHPTMTDRIVLSAMDVGAERADNSVSPHRIVNFPIQDAHFGFLNEIGRYLFENSINWLLGNISTGPVCDFDGNALCDVADLDALLDNLGSDDPLYDLEPDGLITLGDRNVWLSTAGQENLGVDYVTGDTDLNGQVNAGDLNDLGLAWQSTANPGWGNGDFDGNDVVNAGDLNETGINWLHGTAAAAATAVPEPATGALLLISLFGLAGLRRR